MFVDKIIMQKSNIISLFPIFLCLHSNIVQVESKYASIRPIQHNAMQPNIQV